MTEVVNGVGRLGPFTYRQVRTTLRETNSSNGAYLLTVTDGSVIYAGSSGNLSQRFADHMSELNRRIHPRPEPQNAFNRGLGILFYFFPCNSREEAFACEQSLIEQLLDLPEFCCKAVDVKQPWVRATGYVWKGTPHTVESRRKISEARLDFLRNNPNPHLGLKRSAETAARISEAGKRFFRTEEGRKRLAELATSENRLERLREKRNRPVLINGTEYPSVKIASEALGVKYGTLHSRIISSSPEWSEWKFKLTEGPKVG